MTPALHGPSQGSRVTRAVMAAVDTPCRRSRSMARAKRVMAEARRAAKPAEAARAGASDATDADVGGAVRPSAPEGPVIRTTARSMRAASRPVTSWPHTADTRACATVPVRAGRKPA
jgi:hypothetical protein